MPKKTIGFFSWLVCGLGAAFYCYEYLLRILPSVMTEDLLQMFNIDGVAFGNLVAFYYYAYTPMQLPVGIMMDRFGPRKLLMFASLVCALGTYLFSQHDLVTAQIGRFLVGFGSGFAFIGVLKLASLWLPPSRFAFVAGMTQSLGMFGGMVGVVLLSKLVVSVGTYATLNLAAVTGIVLTIALWLIIPDMHNPKAVAPASPKSNYQEFFQAVFKLCKNPQMWVIGIIGCLLYLSLSGFAEVWGIPYLICVYGLSNILAATAVSFVFLGWAIGSPLMGWISEIIGNRRYLIIFGAVLGSLLFAIIIYFPNISIHALKFLLFGFGVCSSTQILIFPIARELNEVSLAGTAIAMINSLVMVGGALSQPLIGKVLDALSGANAKGNLAAFSVSSFQHALTIIPIAFILAAALTFFVKETDSAIDK